MTILAFVLVIMIPSGSGSPALTVSGIASEAACYELGKQIIAGESNTTHLGEGNAHCYSYPIVQRQRT